MKTKGHWVIKTSAGGYWCGNAHFDPQLRKAQVYHWKEAAEDQIEVIKKRKYISADLTFEVIAISEPKELSETQAVWIDDNGDEDGPDYICSSCMYSALLDYRGNSAATRFCPRCGKYMINHQMPEED